MYPNYKRIGSALREDNRRELRVWRTVFTLESLYTTRSINNLLLTREEGMACVADFDFDHRHCSMSHKRRATNAAYFTLNVLRMDIGLHDALQMRSNVTVTDFALNPSLKSLSQKRNVALICRLSATCQVVLHYSSSFYLTDRL